MHVSKPVLKKQHVHHHSASENRKNRDSTKTYSWSMVYALEQRRHGRKIGKLITSQLKKKSHGGSFKQFVSCCFGALSQPGNILSVAFPAENRCPLFSLLVRSQLVVKQAHHKIVSVHGKAKILHLYAPFVRNKLKCKYFQLEWGGRVYPCSQGNQDANLPVKLMRKMGEDL